MRTNKAVRTAIFVPVWAYAAATWASIAHHLFGLPDVVPAATIIAAIGAVVWTFRSRIRVPARGASAPQRHATASK
jgi:hypothetical protein